MPTTNGRSLKTQQRDLAREHRIEVNVIPGEPDCPDGLEKAIERVRRLPE